MRRIGVLTVLLAAVSVAWGQEKPSAATPAPEATPPAAAMDKPVADEAETGSTDAPKADASKQDERGTAPISAEDILKEFQKERPVAEPLMPKPMPEEDGEAVQADGGVAAGSSARLPDGYILVDRTCRLVRDGDWWEVVFKSDNHPETAGEPPLKLLPNRMLERMVRESQSTAGSVEFIVSGEVTDFMGENYVLLRKLMRKREMGNLMQ
ncbi:MAG TPA: hypothetical protein P5572_21045 [Phycisphaerae bacterium]|nr:hypothetical protein [Phycisphaerae bacterium]